jgi:hypothetical protein
MAILGDFAPQQDDDYTRENVQPESAALNPTSAALS